MDRYFVNGKENRGIIFSQCQVAFCPFFLSAYTIALCWLPPLSGPLKDNSVISDCIILPESAPLVNLWNVEGNSRSG